MGAPAVTFNYATLIATVPEFVGVDEPQAQMYFDIATLYFNNCSWPGALRIAPTLLNLLTAHITALLSPLGCDGVASSTGTQSPSSLVGRINSASEGSVSVGVELHPSGSPSESFFTQTKYGFMFWAATAQFRTAHYRARPTIVAPPIYTGRGYVY